MLDLCILTLNVWGIPFISSDRSIRINAIADVLAKGAYHFVALQEVWSESDYQLIKYKTREIYPFTYYFYSGVFGSGLCLFSKYPIISTFFHAWSVNGYVHRIQHGDWFGGKGVGFCRVLVKNKIINIYVAHLHAEYDNEKDDYKAHRVIQAFDTAQFIDKTRGDSALQILAGDLNTEPGDIAYKVLTYSSKMTDCCDDDTRGTNGCEKNSYTPALRAQKNPHGSRIDHIFIRPSQGYKVTTFDYDQPLGTRVPGHSFSYSDHEAVSVKIRIVKEEFCSKDEEFCKKIDDHSEGQEYQMKSQTINALNDSIAICNESLEKLKMDRVVYFSMALFLACLLLAVMDILPPYGLQMLYLVLKFILSGVILFLLFMATLWNTMERHGVLSGKLSMEIVLNSFEKMEEISRT